MNRIVSGTRSLYVTGPRPVEAICRANIGQVQALNLLDEPPWRPAAAKGFPDEDAAWIDGLAQRLDVANQLARRVAATTDPELAVEARPRWRQSNDINWV
ncbi:MAG: hypothetical protein WCC90_09915 [Methylocella sp.]